jgi:hypothetical protein
MMPRPTQEKRTWPTCGTNSRLAHTVANSPTICLHPTRQCLPRRRKLSLLFAATDDVLLLLV